MSISQITHKMAEHRQHAKEQRQLDRAIAHAPTPASRHELEMLYRR